MREAEQIETINAGVVSLRVVGGTFIERLIREGKLSKLHYDAAEHLVSDYYNSGMVGHGASWHNEGSFGWRGSRYEEMSDKQEVHWRSYHAAMNALPPRSRSVVGDAVLWDHVVDVNLLRVGLVALAEHYGR